MSNDTNNGNNWNEVHLPGGALSVQIAPKIELNPVPSDILRSGVSDGGAMRMTPEGTVEAFGGLTRYAVRDDRTSANILDTARGPGGTRFRAITDSHTVMVGGQEVSVGAAVQLGILRRTASGGYEATGKGLEE